MDHRGDAYFSLIAAWEGSHDGVAQDYGLKFQQIKDFGLFFFYPSGTAA